MDWPDPPQKGELTCMFSLKAKRRRGNYSAAEISALTAAGQQESLRGRNAKPRAYYSITDEAGRERTFTFQTRSLFHPVNLALLIPLGLLIYAVPVLAFLAALVPLAARVAEVSSATAYDDRIDYRITREKYDVLEKKLADGRLRPKHIAFFNCAALGLTFARRHGFDAPAPGFCTMPADITAHAKGAAPGPVQKLIAAFSKKKPCIAGEKMPLAERLKRPEGLGMQA